jgi:leader peptidase (prepilin peptidase) / N-methyltransferase
VSFLLVGGCAAGGGAAGLVLDEVAARIPRPAKKVVPEEGTGPLPVAGVADASPPAPYRPPLPGVLEHLVAVSVTALLFGAAAARIGAEPRLAAYCVLFAGLVAVSVADIRVGLVPRKLLYPTLALMAVALVAASAVAGHYHPLEEAAIGGVAAFAVFFVIWFIAPRSMGMGDVRLAGVIGAGLGWIGYRQLYLGFMVAFVVGAAVGIVKMVAQGGGRKTSLPFGPALGVGAVVGVLWGTYLANLWLPGR